MEPIFDGNNPLELFNKCISEIEVTAYESAP